jgi:hypothetical protein
MPVHPLRRVAAALLLGAALLAPLPGCQSPASETPVVRYVGDDRYPMSKATADGDYALYDKDEKKELKTVTLAVGDALGFRHEGKFVIAVAGHDEIKLAPGSYVWKRE